MARPFSVTSRGPSGARPDPRTPTAFPVEVMEVMLSESHPEYGKLLHVTIGAIKGRRYDTERGTPVEDLPWYNPIDPSDLKIPLIGESVLLIESPNQGIIHRSKSRDFCYIATVGILGGISNNAYPSPTKPLGSNGSPTTFTGNMGPSLIPQIGDYVPNKFIAPLVAFEGDRIIQGRWGNSIRFGNTSNGSEDFSFWNGGGADGDPIIIISNGFENQDAISRTEDLNDGSSNIVLSSAQELDIEASNKLPTGYGNLNQYVGSQIVLSSDKIILNSMEDNVVISGKKGVSISTPEWKADITKLCDVIEDLISEVSTIATGAPFSYIPTSGVPGPPVPTTPSLTSTSISKLAAITTKLNALKQ